MSGAIKCLVPLDCLMDTRLGTLKRLNAASAEMIEDSYYHKRTVDRFDLNGSKINQAAYEALYSARDEETLKVSTMTQLPLYLMSLIARLTTTQGMPLLSEQFAIHVNIYPYTLSDEVCQSIQRVIETYTNNAAVVEIVSFAPDELTVSMLKHSYAICFMYNFDEWLMNHTEEFKQATIPEVRIVAPRLYLSDAPAQLIEKVKAEEYGWEQMALMFAGLAGVVFMDVNIFSVLTDTPPDLEV